MKNSAGMLNFQRRLGSITGLALVFFCLLTVPALSVGSGVEFMSDILIYAIMAVGLYVQLALLGLVNFGFSAFFGIGSYASALLVMRWTSDFFPSFLLTMVFSAIVAGLFGLIALRTRQMAFTMITLIFSQLLYVLAVADDRWTGGINGLTGISRPQLPAVVQDGWGWNLDSDTGFYFLVLTIFCATVFLVWVLQRSRLGAILVGIRENEERMVVLGYSVQNYKLFGFIVSGVIGGYAGYLNAMLIGFAGPGALFWTTSGEALLMVILGGTASLAGPVVGAAVFVGISHYAVSFTDHWRLFVGIAFILIVMFAPQGLTRLLSTAWVAKLGNRTPKAIQAYEGNEENNQKRRVGGSTAS